MQTGGEPRRARMGPGALALAWALAPMVFAGCFRDRGAGTLCGGEACLAGTSSTTSGTTSAGETSTGAPLPTTGAPDTTGAPASRAITLRVSAMEFVDPHLFITEEAMDTDTDGTPASCVNDVTMLVNSVINSDIEDNNFNLLLYFEDFGDVHEMRMIDGDCEPAAMAGDMRVCTPSDASPAVILNTEIVLQGGCRELEEGVYAPIDIPLIDDPMVPCLRTKRAFFSLPVSDAVGSLDLRDAQVVATVDDTVTPTRLLDAVVYGFLPMAAAQNLEIDAPLFGLVNLWTVIEAQACTEQYKDYLPSVDMFEINDALVPGAWIAINFTAEQVEYRPQ